MKFNKFSAFPKTETFSHPKNTKNNDFFELIKFLPTLLNNNSKPTLKNNMNKTVTHDNQSANAQAYSEYLARHNEHVRKSKTIQK